MTDHARVLEIESEQVFIVFDKKTGAIVHIHRVVTHRGAETLSGQDGAARAVELATRFGQEAGRLAVLHTDTFNSAIPQRVDVKTGQLILDNPAKPSRAPSRKTIKTPNRQH